MEGLGTSLSSGNTWGDASRKRLRKSLAKGDATGKHFSATTCNFLEKQFPKGPNTQKIGF